MTIQPKATKVGLLRRHFEGHRVFDGEFHLHLLYNKRERGRGLPTCRAHEKKRHTSIYRQLARDLPPKGAWQELQKPCRQKTSDGYKAGVSLFFYKTGKKNGRTFLSADEKAPQLL